MSGFMYKVREFLQNLIPVAIIGALAIGGYHLYKQGTFRNGMRPAMSSLVKKIPYFGTKFGHYTSSNNSSSRSSYVASTPRHSSVSRRHRAPRRHKSLARRAHHKKHRRHHR